MHARATPRRRQNSLVCGQFRGYQPSKGAQVAIAALADSEQHVTIAAGVLTFYQPKPRREFPSALEFARITHRRHHRGSHQRTHSFDLGEPLTALVLLKHSLDSVIVGANLCVTNY